MQMVNMRKYELIDRMNIKLRIKRKAPFPTATYV